MDVYTIKSEASFPLLDLSLVSVRSLVSLNAIVELCSFTSKIFFNLYVYMCAYVGVPAVWEGQIPETGIADSEWWSSCYGCWKLNLGPLR